MIRELLARLAVLLWVMLVLTLPLKAACPSDTEIKAKVAAITGDAKSSYAQKIKQLKELQSAFLSCNKIKNSAYAQIVHRIGDQYSKASDLERAIFYTGEAVQVNLGNGPGLERSFLTHSYFNLGVFYKRLQLPVESHHYFDLCIAAGRPYPEKHFIVFMAAEQNAYSYFQTGDYQKSIEVANDGLLLAENDKNDLAAAPLLAQKAQSQVELDNFAGAEADIQKAIFLLEKAGTDAAHLATSYSIYADLLNKKQRTTESLTYYHKAFELNKANGKLEQCSRDLLDMGSVYLHSLNQAANALLYYREGIKLAVQTGDQYQLAGLYSNIGVVYWKNNDFRQALRYYQKALNVLPLNFSDTALTSNLSLDMLKMVSNDYFVSTILANKGASLLGLYRQTKDRKVLQLALDTYDIADQSVNIMRWKQYGEQSKLLWRKKTKEMYEEAIEVCYQLGNTEKAYYFFEKSRAVLLNDQLSQLIAAQYISAADRRREKQLRVKTYAFTEQLLSAKKAGKNYTAARQDWYDAQNRWEDFIKSLEKKYPAYYQYKYDNSVYSYRSVKNKLSDNQQSLIEYFTGDAAIYVLLLSPSRQKVFKLSYQNYGQHARELLALSADRSLLNQNYERYCGLANLIYQKLFKPLHVEEGRVIISPDDFFIPFEALLEDAKKQNSFLAKKYVFSYVHSMSVLMKKVSSMRNDRSFFGIAPLNYNSKLSPLLGAGQSLKKIVPYFATAKILTGRAATRAQFLRNSTRYQVVQVYAHADADLTEKEPVLYLADSAVYLSEIQKLNYSSTDLIVLSACNTGVGLHAKGEGIFSLARAFMIAGLPTAVTNLWQVDNKFTYRLTETFYKYLQAGFPKDVALNKAKLDLMSANASLGLPYFWAATVIIGNTDGLGRHTPALLPPAALIAAVLLLSALLYFLIKRILAKIAHRF